MGNMEHDDSGDKARKLRDEFKDFDKRILEARGKIAGYAISIEEAMNEIIMHYFLAEHNSRVKRRKRSKELSKEMDSMISQFDVSKYSSEELQHRLDMIEEFRSQSHFNNLQLSYCYIKFFDFVSHKSISFDLKKEILKGIFSHSNQEGTDSRLTETFNISFDFIQGDTYIMAQRQEPGFFLKDFMNKIGSIQEKRNQLLHHAIFTTGGTSIVPLPERMLSQKKPAKYDFYYKKDMDSIDQDFRDLSSMFRLLTESAIDRHKPKQNFEEGIDGEVENLVQTENQKSWKT